MVAINQRNIEYTGSDQGTLYGGIGWTSAGLKVGAIETVLGFVGPSFGLQMTRRSLKGLHFVYCIDQTVFITLHSSQ